MYALRHHHRHHHGTRIVSFMLLLALLAGCQSFNSQPAPPVYNDHPSHGQTPEMETQPVLPPPAPEPPQPLPPPATRSYSLNSASRALVNQAETQRKTGNFMQAGVTLERALRIEPNNPLLWLEYAELRMDETNFPQAENLARKALSLASGDPRTQSNAWRVIADSLNARDRSMEAQQATARANALLGR